MPLLRERQEKQKEQTGLGRLPHRPAQGAVTAPAKGASCFVRQLHLPAREEGAEVRIDAVWRSRHRSLSDGIQSLQQQIKHQRCPWMPR